MYHGLLRILGIWKSIDCLYMPGSTWSDVQSGLRQVHGVDNFRGLYWPHFDQMDGVMAIRDRMISDVQLANEAQRQWDENLLPAAADENGDFDIVSGMNLVKKQPSTR